MTVLLAAFAVVGLVLLFAGGRLGRATFAVAAVPLAASVGWLAWRLPGVVDGRVVTESIAWVPQLGLTLDVRLDGPAALMTAVVSGVGVLVMAYAARYFAPDRPDLGRIAGLLVLFAGAMLGVVQADNLLLLYVCWELTSITSYFLIGNDDTDPAARSASLHALLVTTAGGLAMLGGFVVIGERAGTYRLSELVEVGLPAGSAATVALLLVFVGAATKSAQYPFHSWLPGAMVAPTPISAYLHSATMVKAGVYLVAVLAPIAAGSEVWRPAVLAVGLVTMVAGGLRALRQHDLKRLLAFGTISQLGFMMVLFGAGTPAAATAGWVLLVAHALFKGALFMVVGIVDHQSGIRDLRDLPALPGSDRRWRTVEVVSALSAASMAGVPLVAGFIAKEAAYQAFADGGFSASGVVLAGVVAGSMLTVAYALRFHCGTFVAPRRRPAATPASSEGTSGRAPAPAAPRWTFVAPTAVLAAVTVVLGLVPSLLDGLVGRAVGWLDPAAGADVHLALWHGLGLPLVLSALTLAGGVALFAADRWVRPALALGRRVPSGADVYLAVLQGVGRFARRVTGIVQNGSLPVYAGVILLTAALLPGVVLVLWAEWPSSAPFTELADLPLLGMLIVAALGAALVRRRFSAAVFLGTAGYAMAGLFVVLGDPDLALTQAVIETLTTVAFVLVLRRLPERFERQSSSRRRALRVAIAGIVGATVFAFALVAAGERPPEPVSDEMIERSLPDGHGANVVNVVLVDFRGFDTLGEITVLAVASIGAVALARVSRRPAAARGERPEQRPADRRSEVERIVFIDVSVQIIFYAVVLASLWLLFAGHNQPGGGFVGGLLVGTAIALRYVAGGMKEVRGLSRFKPWTVLGTGLLIASTIAVVPLLFGQSVLEVGETAPHLPVVGDVGISSALLFDIGVYLTVVGMVLMTFEAFGDDPAEVVQ